MGFIVDSTPEMGENSFEIGPIRVFGQYIKEFMKAIIQFLRIA